MARGVPIYKLTLPEAPLRESAPVLLVRFQEMMDWSADIRDPAKMDELHNMRIAAKRLRYTMEVFAPCFGPEFTRILKTIEEIQERIGAIHDCDVLIPLLEETLTRETKQEKKQALQKGGGPPPYLAAEGLVPLIAKKQTERVRLHREFVTFWEELPPGRLLETRARLVQNDPASIGK